MEALEIKTALDGIKGQVEAKSTEQKAEVKSMIEALEAKMKEEVSSNVTELKSALEAIQAHADKLDVKLQEKSVEVKGAGYFDNVTKSIEDNLLRSRMLKEVKFKLRL